ncbi:MAG: hypothetical protein HY867_08575 [Chloroflexi bacterium]|nr:hypothetical protein [Chloroflexota bacterium]
MITLQELKSHVEELAKKIDAPAKFFPTFGMSRNDGTPNIEINDNAFYYEAYDRDAVCIRRRTTRLPKLLYWIFENITHQMGFAYESAHRDPSVPLRKLAFQHQLELLEILQQQWRELREREIAEILDRHPYQYDLVQSKTE